jgi:hypothetical protein
VRVGADATDLLDAHGILDGLLPDIVNCTGEDEQRRAGLRRVWGVGARVLQVQCGEEAGGEPCKCKCSRASRCSRAATREEEGEQAVGHGRVAVGPHVGSVGV